MTVINQTHKNLSNSAKDLSTDTITDQQNKEQNQSIHLNFDQIIEKVNAEQYTDIEQLSEDIETIINDVKDAFKEEEKEFQDANELFEFFLDVKQDAYVQDDSMEDLKDNEQDIHLPQQEQQQSQIDQDADMHKDESNEPKEDFKEEHKEETSYAAEIEHLSNENAESAEGNFEHEAALNELVQTISDAIDNDGRPISLLFQVLPPKSKFKDYYDMISNPIDLKTIEGKNRNNEYRNLNELEKDLLLMVRNAKIYNKPGSQIYRDANTLKKMIVAKKIELEQRKCQPLKKSNRIKAKQTSTPGSKFNKSFEDSPNASLNQEDSLVDEGNDSGLDEDDPMYKLYDFVCNFKNAEDVRLSDPFMRLPNRRFYPDYYDEIKRPTSLSKIKSKIRTNQYSNLNEMLDELNIMFKNALKYNLRDSQIAKDALELQKECFQKAKEYTDYEPIDDVSMSSEDDDQVSNYSQPQTSKKTSTYRKKTIQPSPAYYEVKPKLNKSLTGEVDVSLRRRLKQLYKCLINYCDEEGRYPIDLFMEKPSRKDYPGRKSFLKFRNYIDFNFVFLFYRLL